MATSLPGLNRTPTEISLAERLGRESWERIADRMWLGTPFLTSVCVEAEPSRLPSKSCTVGTRRSLVDPCRCFA
jgi:hypothetical protein